MNSQPTKPQPWIGVDLDGTLAFYDGWKGQDHIGEPIPAMVKRIKAWLEAGQQVKIFTARVCVTDQYSSVSGMWANQEFADRQRTIIAQWCAAHLGVVLEVTCVKDFLCVQIWDDRAVQVVLNQGCVATHRGDDDSDKAWSAGFSDAYNDGIAASFSMLPCQCDICREEYEKGVDAGVKALRA